MRREASRYLRENFIEHVPVFVGLVQECREKNYIKKGVPLQQLVGSFIGVVIPGVMFGVIERCGCRTFLGLPVEEFGGLLFSERGIRLRIELLFDGIGRKGGRK
ncbi:MAG: hypothetical protein PHW69_09100 [Elusimicrobiaceae bacterium]|nr:hypothetical protein [Elusimicrobiaceae bacterium]